MLSAFIDCCIYSHTLQTTFDHKEAKSYINLIQYIPKSHKLNHISFIKINMKHEIQNLGSKHYGPWSDWS